MPRDAPVHAHSGRGRLQRSRIPLQSPTALKLAPLYFFARPPDFARVPAALPACLAAVPAAFAALPSPLTAPLAALFALLAAAAAVLLCRDAAALVPRSCDLVRVALRCRVAAPFFAAA